MIGRGGMVLKAPLIEIGTSAFTEFVNDALTVTGMAVSGWSKVKDCATGSTWWRPYGNAQHCDPTSILGWPNMETSHGMPSDPAIDSVDSWVFTEWFNAEHSLARMTHDETWNRTSGNQAFAPRLAIPLPSPAWHPLPNFPISVPQFRPHVRPHKRPRKSPPGSEPKRDKDQRPDVDPTDEPWPEHNPDKRYRYDIPVVRVQPPPDKKSGFKPRPRQPEITVPVILPPDIPGIDVLPPDVSISFPPDITGGSNRRDAASVRRMKKAKAKERRPKRKKVVQKKLNVAVIGGMVWTGINTATEAMDFVIAMHNSLPERYRLNSKASKRQKLEYMLTNLDVWLHIDAAEAVQNYINMQVADFVAAVGSDSIKKLQQQMGSATGLDKAIRESSKYAELDNPTLIPVLDIDMSDGSVSLTSSFADVSFSWR